MLPRQLVTCSVLALSITSAAFFGNTNSAYAFGGKCGDSALPCNETAPANIKTVQIKYTIENKTRRTIKFRLPSGRTYQLAPGQRGNYKNTATPNRLRIFIFDTNKSYVLKNGNYQFRQSATGNKIYFVRAPKVTRVTINKLGIAPVLSKPPVLIRKTQTVVEPTPETTETELPDQDLQNLDSQETLETDSNSQSDSVLPTLINKVGDVLITYINHQSNNNSEPNTEENQNLESEDNTEIESNLPDSPPQIAQAGNSIDQVLAKWGWTKVPCNSEVVSITGLGEETVCVNPTSEIPSGQYQYNQTSHQLTPIAQ